MQVKRQNEFIMKTKLHIPMTVLSIAFLLARASAQQLMESGGEAGGETTTDSGPGGSHTTTITRRSYLDSRAGLPQAVLETSASRGPMVLDPRTGLPVSVPDIDPATGLPADGSPPFKDANGAATWIDPSWKDPNKALAKVNYLSLPLSEVANQLLTQYNNSFDIIFPTASVDPTQINVVLRLNNVKASEIFSAMNLQFELDNTPVRWELTLNGSRPTAILRSLPQLAPPQIRKVFFVGDILADYSGTNDEIKLDRISDTILHLGAAGETVQKYIPGQLLIVSGTPDQVDLVDQTLRALKEKAEFDTRWHKNP